MSKVRAYHPFDLETNNNHALSDDAFHHLIRVLRLKEEAEIILFDGKNNEALATITDISKKQALCAINTVQHKNREHPRHLHLAQCLGKGDKMEWIIQKAVELGVAEFTPIISQRTVVKLPKERLDKKMNAWEKVIIGASEQCGRNQLMRLNPAKTLDQFFKTSKTTSLFFHPDATASLTELSLDSSAPVCLLIGPEGGFSESEVTLAKEKATAVGLGPRILRMETAALVGISLLLF